MVQETIRYNIPFEVNAKQYEVLMRDMCGVCAGREDAGKFYIMVWMPQYKNEVSKVLNRHK